MTQTKLVNVANDFYEDKFDELCAELERGELVHIYVDCIGHTRAVWVEARYVEELKKIYGSKLEVLTLGWERAYRLKP